MFRSSCGAKEDMSLLTAALANFDKSKPLIQKTLGVLIAVQGIFKKLKVGESRGVLARAANNGILEDHLKIDAKLEQQLSELAAQ